MTKCPYNFEKGKRIYTVQVWSGINGKSKQFSISKTEHNFSVDEVFTIVKEYCDNHLEKALDPRLHFDYIKKNVSHRIGIILWNDDRTNAKQFKSFYIYFPQYTSIEIATPLAEYLLHKKVDWKTRP